MAKNPKHKKQKQYWNNFNKTLKMASINKKKIFTKYNNGLLTQKNNNEPNSSLVLVSLSRQLGCIFNGCINMQYTEYAFSTLKMLVVKHA